MYSPDKMMGTKAPTGLHGPITSSGACFAGRYSPTYRSPDPMPRRCMPNPSTYNQLAALVAFPTVLHCRQPIINAPLTDDYIPGGRNPPSASPPVPRTGARSSGEASEFRGGRASGSKFLRIARFFNNACAKFDAVRR
ncbi:hypothetical protein GWI33_013986 [Rhynchophorus ferrugineus]|uniref:Uncharacterized protein n=1 Tax=Rhynchophorus ferrugineus TaxID=354439 RepID=A0A834I727_RHYFE|nr:hypothetical protein GWI33_013986 [Rhynchophorus ferrugineus]